MQMQELNIQRPPTPTRGRPQSANDRSSLAYIWIWFLQCSLCHPHFSALSSILINSPKSYQFSEKVSNTVPPHNYSQTWQLNIYPCTLWSITFYSYTIHLYRAQGNVPFTPTSMKVLLSHICFILMSVEWPSFFLFFFLSFWVSTVMRSKRGLASFFFFLFYCKKWVVYMRYWFVLNGHVRFSESCRCIWTLQWLNWQLWSGYLWKQGFLKFFSWRGEWK